MRRVDHQRPPRPLPSPHAQTHTQNDALASTCCPGSGDNTLRQGLCMQPVRHACRGRRATLSHQSSGRRVTLNWMSSCLKVSFSPSATLICSWIRSMPVIISVTGCSTCKGGCGGGEVRGVFWVSGLRQANHYYHLPAQCSASRRVWPWMRAVTSMHGTAIIPCPPQCMCMCLPPRNAWRAQHACNLHNACNPLPPPPGCACSSP